VRLSRFKSIASQNSSRYITIHLNSHGSEITEQRRALACLPLVHVVGQVHCFSVRLLIRGIHVLQPCVLVPVTACASSPVPGDKKQLRAACCILCIMFCSIRVLVVSMVASQVRCRDLGSNPCSHTAAWAMQPLLVLIFSPATTSVLSQSLHAVTCPVVTTATGFLPHRGQDPRRFPRPCGARSVLI
jgi:hypothetical protein